MFKKLSLSLIRYYQRSKFIHQFIGKSIFLSDKNCRFDPTCSEFTYQAVKKYGVVIGIWKGFKRIIRCHPWGGFGYDPLR